MKNKAAVMLKRIVKALTSMAKAKTLALKGQANALKTRWIIFSLLRKKKMFQMSSISQKLHALMGKQDKDEESICHDDEGDHRHHQDDEGNQSKAIVVYNHMSLSRPTPSSEFPKNTEDHDNYHRYLGYEEGDGDEKYPDLTHSMFDSKDLDFEDPGGSVIDIVKNSKKEGEEFRLEDEIDQVADLFIRRFHRQMRMQKQLSLKRFEEMLERSA